MLPRRLDLDDLGAANGVEGTHDPDDLPRFQLWPDGEVPGPILSYRLGEEARQGRWLDYVQGITQALAAAGHHGSQAALQAASLIHPLVPRNPRPAAQPPSVTPLFVDNLIAAINGAAGEGTTYGTGTSAKLACLAADGKLAPGASWQQQSITGSIFSASYQPHGELSGQILPCIRGQAYVTART